MTNKNGLKAEEISLIINACAVGGVRVLKYAGLYLEFGKPAKTPQVEQDLKFEVVVPQDRVDAAAIPHPTVAEITDTQKRESERSLLKEELDFRDDQLAEMRITDPYAAEQLEINAQLEESNGGTSEEA